jgi:hypothetical protein
LYDRYKHDDPNVKLLNNRFSPVADSKIWQADLLWLQQNSAEISGIPTNKFKHVSVINLDEIDPEDIDVFDQKGPENLFIIYGTAKRKKHLPISGGATIVGNEAVITLKDSSFFYKLDIPKARISVYINPENHHMFDYHTKCPDNEWGIGSSEDLADVLTNSAMLIAGDYPLVYLRSSNLIGVSIYGNKMAKNIVVNGNETDSIVIADCDFDRPKDNNHNSFIQDCKNIRLERNQFYATYGKYGPIFHNCKNITFLDVLDVCDSIQRIPPVGLFSRGTKAIDS